MDRILVSACLIGRPVRWDGTARPSDDPRLARWAAEGRLVPICPEMLGGLPVPRPAAEIEPGGDAAAVLAGRARIVDRDGADHTAAFRTGAAAAVAAAVREGCRFALLAEASPSCGPNRVHDGRFSGVTIAGDGVTAHALRAAGVAVFALGDLDALAARLDR